MSKSFILTSVLQLPGVGNKLLKIFEIVSHKALYIILRYLVELNQYIKMITLYFQIPSQNKY